MHYVGGFVALLIGVGLVWYFVRSRNGDPAFAGAAASDPDDEPPLSIVALMAELPFVDIDVLVRVMETAFDVDFDAADAESEDDGEESPGELRFADGDNFVMTTPMGTYMIRLQGEMHGLIVHEEPYFEDIDAAVDSVTDLRGKQALAEHRCWIAVDHVGDDPSDDELRETYARIGKLLLEVIDPSLCKAILMPRHQRFYPWREGMEEALTSGDVIEELNEVAHVPVAPVDGDSPEMKAAVEEAQTRWPQFLEAFESGSGESFIIKFLLPGDDEDSCEFPWMNVTKIHGQIIQGKLANEPIGRSDLHEGSTVTTNLNDLNDWLFIDTNGEQQGGFTIPVLMKGLEGEAEE